MKPMKCEVCDGNDFTKIDGMFKCNYCGIKYTLEEVKKIMISDTSEVIPAYSKKKKLKNDIATFIKIGNYVNAIKSMIEYTDTFPDDIDGYKMKLDFICTKGCAVSFGYLNEHYLKVDNPILEYAHIFYSHNNVFKSFKDNISILNRLTSTDNTKEYALKLLSLIKSGQTPFRFDSWGNRDLEICNPNTSGYRNDVRRVQNLIKNILIEYLGDEVGTIAFNEGIENSNEYNLVRQYDNQIIISKYELNAETLRLRDCIFLLGNQILSWEIYGSEHDEYRFVFATLSHIPDIISLTEEKQKAIDQKMLYRKNNQCQYCGGAFKGLFTIVCSKCGKPKDY